MTDSHPIVIEFFTTACRRGATRLSERLHAFVAAHPRCSMMQRSYPLVVSPMLCNRQLYTDPKPRPSATW